MAGFGVITGGPEIPLEVIEALENERLVFFCGAGISIGTGLPNFRNLTLEAIRKLVGAPNDCPTDPALREAFCISQQYDKALDILERDTAGNALRRWVAERLVAAPDPSDDLPLHRAILALAKRRDSLDGKRLGYRLVTTNYDDRFERAGLKHRWIEAAPHLARPRADKDRSSYASFLHGRIETEEAQRDPEYRELVLTSADFGNAYLRDGFATRFVLELFREFTVLFIGYSIDDPVMRYLVDIFATERIDDLRGQFKKAYAIASFSDGAEEHERRLWQAKNVEPILYDARDKHRLLTELMARWARLHTSGADGRFSKFMEITRTPYGPTSRGSDLATAAWALADKGFRTAERLAADRLADDDGHISWFGPLLEAEIFDPRDERQPRRSVKLWEIPEIARPLCRWAMRHLETRELVDWAIASRFLRLSPLRQPFFDGVIDRLRAAGDSPPIGAHFRQFWEFIVEITRRVNTTSDYLNLSVRSGVTPTVETVGNFLQRPDVSITWPKGFAPSTASLDEGRKPASLGQFELTCHGDRRGLRAFKIIFADPTIRGRSRSDLSPFLDQLTTLLLELCRLGRMIEAHFATGSSIGERISIEPHPSNNLEFHGLSWLIEAMVLSFDVAVTDDNMHATAVALRWRLLWRRHEFSLFGRLYLYAAVRLVKSIDADSLIDDLLRQPDVLWSDEYRAEVLPILRLRVKEASSEKQNALVERLLGSPPDDLYGEDSD